MERESVDLRNKRTYTNKVSATGYLLRLLRLLRLTRARVAVAMPDARPSRTTAATAAQPALPGFGPADRDGFRFTWYNTRVGAAVWVEHRGRWRAGVVVGLGRKRATVAIEAAGSSAWS